MKTLPRYLIYQISLLCLIISISECRFRTIVVSTTPTVYNKTYIDELNTDQPTIIISTNVKIQNSRLDVIGQVKASNFFTDNYVTLSEIYHPAGANQTIDIFADIDMGSYNLKLSTLIATNISLVNDFSVPQTLYLNKIYHNTGDGITCLFPTSIKNLHALTGNGNSLILDRGDGQYSLIIQEYPQWMVREIYLRHKPISSSQSFINIRNDIGSTVRAKTFLNLYDGEYGSPRPYNIMLYSPTLLYSTDYKDYVFGITSSGSINCSEITTSYGSSEIKITTTVSMQYGIIKDVSALYVDNSFNNISYANNKVVTNWIEAWTGPTGTLNCGSHFSTYPRDMMARVMHATTATISGISVPSYTPNLVISTNVYVKGKLQADIWDIIAPGDNLGNHQATTTLNMSGYDISNVDQIYCDTIFADTYFKLPGYGIIEKKEPSTFQLTSDSTYVYVNDGLQVKDSILTPYIKANSLNSDSGYITASSITVLGHFRAKNNAYFESELYGNNITGSAFFTNGYYRIPGYGLIEKKEFNTLQLTSESTYVYVNDNLEVKGSLITPNILATNGTLRISSLTVNGDATITNNLYTNNNSYANVSYAWSEFSLGNIGGILQYDANTFKLKSIGDFVRVEDNLDMLGYRIVNSSTIAYSTFSATVITAKYYYDNYPKVVQAVGTIDTTTTNTNYETLSGMDITVETNSNANIMIQFSAPFTNSNNDITGYARIYYNNSTQLCYSAVNCHPTRPNIMNLLYVHSVGAGTHNYKIQWRTAANTIRQYPSTYGERVMTVSVYKY